MHLRPTASFSADLLRAAAVIACAFLNSSRASDKFKVFGDGDFLLLPVEVGGKTHSFVVDTGAPVTTFDNSLLHGSPKLVSELKSGSGAKVPTGLYDVPTSRLGTHRLDSDLEEIRAQDLSGIRRASGHEVDGIVGMDLLRRHIVSIDFDNQSLEIDADISALSDRKCIDLTFNDSGMPCVRGSLEGCYEIEFVIDTGCMTFCSGLLDGRMCRYAEQAGKLESIGGQTFTDASGNGNTGIYRATGLSLSGSKLANPIFQEAKWNCVGLYYLSRFNVTFDFPNRKIWLIPGKNYRRPDGRNLSGMDLVRKDGRIFVDSTNSDSAAEKAGLNEDDEILQIADLNSAHSRTYEMEYRLAQPGSVSVLAQRNSKQFKTVLDLK